MFLVFWFLYQNTKTKQKSWYILQNQAVSDFVTKTTQIFRLARPEGKASEIPKANLQKNQSVLVFWGPKYQIDLVFWGPKYQIGLVFWTPKYQKLKTQTTKDSVRQIVHRCRRGTAPAVVPACPVLMITACNGYHGWASLELGGVRWRGGWGLGSGPRPWWMFMCALWFFGMLLQVDFLFWFLLYMLISQRSHTYIHTLTKAAD